MAETRNEWIEELGNIEKRWFVFADRLEQRTKEFAEASIPELREIYKNDTDAVKREYMRLATSVETQIESVRKKAEKTYEGRVRDYYEWAYDILGDSEDKTLKKELQTLIDEIETRCEERYEALQETLEEWPEKIKEATSESAEDKYKAILDEYERIKDKFTCKQCRGPITIPEIFLITTYVECPSCQTQNTFEPSTQSRQLDFIAQELAGKRTAHMYKAYEDEQDREREIENRIDDLESDIDDFDEDDEENAEELTTLKEELAALKSQYNAIKANIPQLYKAYLKSKFDEWIKLVPQLAEQNKKVYEGWLKDYERRGE